MPSTETRGALATDQVFGSPEDEKNALLSRPAVALLAAGAIGFAVGAIVWRYQRSNTSRFSTFDRAVDLARSGAVDTVHKLKKRLRDEGYSAARIQGHAKQYLTQLIDGVSRGVR